MAERVGLLLAVLLVLVACGKGGSSVSTYTAPRAPVPSEGAPPWPRPANTTKLGEKVGISPERKEFLTFHVHAHLDVFVNGERVVVPPALGIEIGDPGVKYFPRSGEEGASYGGIERCDDPCISALHTHDDLGVIHIEAPTKRDYTLGQLFAMWAVRLDRSCVGGYCTPAARVATFVDGKLDRDPADLVLADGQEIAIVIGSPPRRIPQSYDFSGA